MHIYLHVTAVATAEKLFYLYLVKLRGQIFYPFCVSSQAKCRLFCVICVQIDICMTDQSRTQPRPLWLKTHFVQRLQTWNKLLVVPHLSKKKKKHFVCLCFVVDTLVKLAILELSVVNAPFAQNNNFCNSVASQLTR